MSLNKTPPTLKDKAQLIKFMDAAYGNATNPVILVPLETIVIYPINIHKYLK